MVRVRPLLYHVPLYGLLMEFSLRFVCILPSRGYACRAYPVLLSYLRIEVSGGSSS
jgi:hypothetical protein